ncbi:hypothetical protein HUK80_07645 [Flavobacterium sp. MAH-1]|uniref:Uncharacterized protein n=1 Tax=Flavobacterium agri TaxID=2743471 RepID=A0A7Y8Y1C1_9FLAO|nr:hypothetical protein [Flavobacterium agri]NUY80760.1 hypothetical protein [Flavobacterium agri]NYA70784.1 hypothetical protein [Flavobacterium agri]
MKTLYFTQTDILLAIIATSGVLAGILAYLIIPCLKRESQHCIKSVLFGIMFALLSNLTVHFVFGNAVKDVPSELQLLFLWCTTFFPAFLLTLAYDLMARRYENLDF